MEQIFWQFPEVAYLYNKGVGKDREMHFWQTFFWYYVAKLGDDYRIDRSILCAVVMARGKYIQEG